MSITTAAPLIVASDFPARSLAQQALARPRSDQYDPVIVTGAAGELAGIVTIKQLLLTASQIEVQLARLSNPLTGLPGGRAAGALGGCLHLLGPGAKLGHAGADDFVAVAPEPPSTDALRTLCTAFDRDKLDLFRPEDRERGFFLAHNEPPPSTSGSPTCGC